MPAAQPPISARETLEETLRKAAFKAPSLQYQSAASAGMRREGNIRLNSKGSTRMGLTEHQTARGAGNDYAFAKRFCAKRFCAMRFCRVPACIVAIALVFGFTTAASAQGAVR